jgi:hypothetical protein
MTSSLSLSFVDAYLASLLDVGAMARLLSARFQKLAGEMSSSPHACDCSLGGSPDDMAVEGGDPLA